MNRITLVMMNGRKAKANIECLKKRVYTLTINVVDMMQQNMLTMISTSTSLGKPLALYRTKIITMIRY